jgi:hypothetical protein
VADDLILKLRERQADARRFIDIPEAFPHRVYPPVTLKEVEMAEAELGFPFPAMLRRVYLQVGNGGFGPGFGILALNDRGARNYHLPLVDWYRDAMSFSHPDYPPWPRKFLTVCDWGDSITSVLDWTDPAAPVSRFNGDQYEGGALDSVMKLEAPSLRDWLEEWVAGVHLFERGRL